MTPPKQTLLSISETKSPVSCSNGPRWWLFILVILQAKRRRDLKTERKTLTNPQKQETDDYLKE